MPNQKKRILFYTRPIVPPWDEASKNLAFDIASNLNKKKFKAILLTSRKNSFNQKLKKNWPWINPEEIYSSPEVNLNLKNKIKLLKRLFRIKLKEDLIHFLFTPRSLTSLLIRLRLKFSRVKTIQTVATISKKNFQKPEKLKKILFADRVIVQSKNTFNKIKKIGFENAKLIYPGINLDKYRPTKKDPGLLRKLKIKKQEFILLYTGEYVRLKAIDDIIEACQSLWEKNKKIKLILACRIKSKKDEKKKKRITKKLRTEGLQGNVIFIDTFDEMEKLYNISDLNVFPAREMAGKFDLPLTLIESMACGKPIVVSKLKNLKELVGKNSRGLLVETGNPKDLAEKISILKSDKKMYNEMTRRSVEFIKNNFDIKKKTKEYEEIYKNLTKR